MPRADEKVPTRGSGPGDEPSPPEQQQLSRNDFTMAKGIAKSLSKWKGIDDTNFRAIFSTGPTHISTNGGLSWLVDRFYAERISELADNSNMRKRIWESRQAFSHWLGATAVGDQDAAFFHISGRRKSGKSRLLAEALENDWFRARLQRGWCQTKRLVLGGVFSMRMPQALVPKVSRV